jgi:hypothetical protein
MEYTNIYFNKYLKYKNKYMNLKKLYGGFDEKNIIFSCTTLDETSTLSVNFNTINDLINRLIGEKIKKNTYLLYKTQLFVSDEHLRSQYLKEVMETNNYNIMTNLVVNINLLDFINLSKDIKFDIIVMTQCNETVSMILGDDWRIHYNKFVWELINHNLFSLYETLNDTGYIINIGYDKAGINDIILENFSNSYSSLISVVLPLFMYINELINILFIKVDTGIYQKNIGIIKSEYLLLCDMLKEKLIKHIKSIIEANSSQPIIYTEIYKQIYPQLDINILLDESIIKNHFNKILNIIDI